jgi:adenylate kinase
MKVFVGGINGVGKTSVVKAAARELGYEYIHGTSLLMNYLGFDSDYEQLRALKQEERDIALGKCMEELLASKDKVIADSHYMGLVRGKVDQVTDAWISGFDAFVLISAPFEDVWSRIEADSKHRDRALFPQGNSTEENKRMLYNYMTRTRDEFLALSLKYHKPHIEISNRKDEQKLALGDLVRFVQGL